MQTSSQAAANGYVCQVQKIAQAVSSVVCMQAAKRYPSLVGCKAAAEQLLQIKSRPAVAVGSLQVLAAALQDAQR